MKEKWSIITGYNNYAISSLGRVRNLNTGRILKHQSSERGGFYAFIQLSKKGNRTNHNVHILVAQAFIGPRAEGYVTHHKDTNRMNPNLDNLEYVTAKENIQRIYAVK